MIELNGIRLKRVIRVECSHDTDFKTVIEFYFDTRLNDCSELSGLMFFDLTQVAKQTKDDIGVFRITLPQETDISITCE